MSKINKALYGFNNKKRKYVNKFSVLLDIIYDLVCFDKIAIINRLIMSNMYFTKLELSHAIRILKKYDVIFEYDKDKFILNRMYKLEDNPFYDVCIRNGINMKSIRSNKLVDIMKKYCYIHPVIQKYSGAQFLMLQARKKADKIGRIPIVKVKEVSKNNKNNPMLVMLGWDEFITLLGISESDIDTCMYPEEVETDIPLKKKTHRKKQ